MRTLTIILSFLILNSIGCTQEKSNEEKKTLSGSSPITESNKEVITGANYIQKEAEFIKPALEGLQYYFSVTNNECSYEFLVNDIPVFSFDDEAAVLYPVCINPYISKSGEQSFTYRLYPKKSDTDSAKQLADATSIKIKLVGRNESDRINAYKNEKHIFSHKSATKADGKTFIASGKDFYEYTITFDAEVPYTIHDDTDSEDLRKLDQKLLLAKTEKAYHYYWELIRDKKINDYARLGFRSDIDEVLSLYMDKETLKAKREEEKEFFLFPGFKIKPMENYRMKLYGNGKIVCLEQTNEDRKFLKRSPIWGEIKSQYEEPNIYFYKLYLYIPKGKDTFRILYKSAGFDDNHFF